MPVDPFLHPCWYAIQTHSWYEKRVRDQMTTKAITTLLPLWQQRRRWTDRVKLIELPLFRGYLFGYFTFQQKFDVLTTVGVARLVSFNGGAGPNPRGADPSSPHARHPPAPLRSASIPHGGHASSRHPRPLGRGRGHP